MVVCDLMRSNTVGFLRRSHGISNDQSIDHECIFYGWRQMNTISNSRNISTSHAGLVWYHHGRSSSAVQSSMPKGGICIYSSRSDEWPPS